LYCDPSVRDKVKATVKEKGYLKGADEAKIVRFDELFEAEDARNDPFHKAAYNAPYQRSILGYDSASESLEPIYFWLLDFIPRIGYGKVTKLVDNFSSSAGSAHFSEMGMKATKMQEEASKTLGAVNQVLKSILNILYDLRQFKIRLGTYKRYKDKKSTKEEKQGALLSLKQIWLDSVDIQRGNTAIKAMAQQFDYVTLIDAFMAAESSAQAAARPDAGGLDLNDRVKRIVTQRLSEFELWVEHSDYELEKRYLIEKNYLRSQYNTLKLYSRWVKPYLEAARKLEQSKLKGVDDAGLVSAFNTIILDLSFIATNKYDPEDDIKAGILPEAFAHYYKEARKYNGAILVEFKFRGIPQRAGQGYTFGGRTTVTFHSFSLNDEELMVFMNEMEKDDFRSMLQWVGGATDESLKPIQNDIEAFLNEKDVAEEHPKEGEKKKEEYKDDANPFTALFNFFSDSKPKEKDTPEQKLAKLANGKIKPDDEYEKIIRTQAIFEARERGLLAYETYKKAHGMIA
jgi:hypothetical protein